MLYFCTWKKCIKWGYKNENLYYYFNGWVSISCWALFFASPFSFDGLAHFLAVMFAIICLYWIVMILTTIRNKLTDIGDQLQSISYKTSNLSDMKEIMDNQLEKLEDIKNRAGPDNSDGEGDDAKLCAKAFFSVAKAEVEGKIDKDEGDKLRSRLLQALQTETKADVEAVINDLKLL